jgi:uncharacterized damage-inducible protein DinB
MSEIGRIRDQLQRSFERGAWSGPAVLELLEGVTAAQAARRPIPGAHTIGELVRHMTTWKTVVSRRLEGESFLDVRPEVDWPPIPTGDEGDGGWKAALAGLRQAHDDLVKRVAELRDEALDQPPAPGTSSRYVLLHGVIQHDLYHGGQIALLRKP